MNHDLAEYFNLVYRLIKYPNCEERTIWLNKLPEIKFPDDYNIKLIPPCTPAIIQFHITLKKNKNCLTSIFLDCYELMGVYYSPYWEIHPFIEGSIRRCGIYNTKKLLELIDQSLKEQIKEEKKENDKKKL